MPLFIKILLILLHFVSFYVIYLIVQPAASWYLSAKPAVGVDLYYTATYVAYHIQNFSLPFNSFKDIWFGGYPLARDIFQLPFYAMVPFSKYFGLIEGIKIFIMTSLFFLGIFSYMLFYYLSKNIFLSLVLVLGVFFSTNLYGAAIWGGSLPYFTAQMFYPLVLLLLARYMFEGQKRWLYLASLFSGIAALIHVFPVYTYIISGVFFLIFFYVKGGKFQFFTRVKDFLLFFMVTILIALRVLQPVISETLNTFLSGRILDVFKQAAVSAPSPVTSGGAGDSSGLAEFYSSLFTNLFTHTAPILFYIVIFGFLFFVISIIFGRNSWFSTLRKAIPFLLITFYQVFHVYANASGLVFLSQGWYRMFWAFPITLGALAAVCWGGFFQFFNLKISNSIKSTIISSTKFTLVLGISLLLSLAGYWYFISHKEILVEQLKTKSELSSAFPEALSIKTDAKSQEELKHKLLPSFIDPNDQNSRLYSADATISIWWNSFFKMPLARGYIDPPIGTHNRGGFFWLDIAIANDSLVRDFKASEEQALNNSLFLIDWYGVRYFEGGRMSSKGPSPGPSTYLTKNNIFDKEELATTSGGLIKWQTASGKPELIMDLPQWLHYFRVADKYTSPILYPTNAPSILVASNDPGYEDILRILALENINSKKLIPANLGNLDNVSLKDLKNFDAVLLHNYYYTDKKIFKTLEEYVKNGGNLFIDTGAEARESSGSNLPGIFPVKNLERKGLGKEFELEKTSDSLLETVNPLNFGPLIFNDNEWKLSVPKIDSDLKDNAQVLLKHKNKPVLVLMPLGKGKIIWSGINLPYHYNQYKSEDEARLFLNILKSFVKIEDNPPVEAKAVWEKPEKVIISTKDHPRGVLFKEQLYSGWSAKLSSGEGLKLYKAGPTFPGFIYAPIPSGNKPVEVVFSYSGEVKHWIIFMISVFTGFLMLDFGVFGGKVSTRLFHPVIKKFRKKVGLWWEREDES